MANPQIENGYARLSNEILEALCRFNIPGEAMRLFMFILRKTYGWSKKEDKISLSQISLGTGLKKSNIIRARNKLLARNLICVLQEEKGCMASYRINKNFSQWKPLPKRRSLSKQRTHVIHFDNTSLSTWRPTKEINTKHTVTKETMLETPREFQPVVYELVEFFIAKILENQPKHSLKNPKVQAKAKRDWPVEIEKMVRLDSRDPPEIRAMIEWVTQEKFWAGHVMSARTLRQRWDQLAWKKESEEKNGIYQSTDQKIMGLFKELNESNPSASSEVSDFFEGTENPTIKPAQLEAG